MTKKCTCFDLTVDVNMLMIAFHLSDQQDRNNASFNLTKAIAKNNSYFLALDKRGMIKYLYEHKLKHSSCLYWLKLLASNNKIRNVEPVHPDKGTQTALNESHFHWADLIYVKTSAGTECKILVSHEQGFSSKVCQVLRRRLGVLVYKSEDCLSLKVG